MTKQKTAQKSAAKTKTVKPAAASSADRNRTPFKLALGIVAALLVVVLVWIVLPLSNQSGPANAVETVWQAVKKHDLETFKKNVDTDAFVKSVIEQVIAYEEINNADGANVNNFRQLMSQGMIGAFRNDLAATYSVQMSELVESGNLEQRKEGLLWRLWQQTGAKPEYFKDYEVLDQNDSNALLTLNFERADLGGAVLSLNLLLEYNRETAAWQVTGVPNLANFLFTISTRQKEMLAELNDPIQKRLNDTVAVLDVQKAAGVSEDVKTPTSNGVLWHVAYRNNSSRNISSFKAEIVIKDANGQYLGTLNIADTDGLASGQTAERAWPMPLNPNNTADAEILAASARVLKAEIAINEVVFKNGDRLALFTELPEPYQAEESEAE